MARATMVIIIATVNSPRLSVSSGFSLKSVVDWLKNLFSNDTDVSVENYEQHEMNRVMLERVNKLKIQLHAGWKN